MIRVGIIDSGLNYDDTIAPERILAGACIRRNEAGVVKVEEGDIADNWGHGTTCFSIINGLAPGLEYVIVKIFHTHNGSSDSGLLSKAIGYCIKKGVNLVNMSLGVKAFVMPGELQKACDMACEKGIILVAAAHNSNKQCYPAYYPKVIGVGSFFSHQPNDIFYAPGTAIPFYANGSGSNPYDNHATSFSCARLTGMIAAMLTEKGMMTQEAIVEAIIQQSQPLPPDIISYRQSQGYFVNPGRLNKTRQRAIATQYLLRQHKYKQVKRVLLASYSPRASWFRKINTITINSEFIVVGTEHIRGCEIFSSGWLDQEHHAQEYDTVALGNLLHYTNSPFWERLNGYLLQFIRANKGFIFFDNESANIIQQLKQQAPGANNPFYFWGLDMAMYQDMAQFQFLPPGEAPVLSVVTAGHADATHIGVYIKKLVEKNGNRVAFIATDPHAEIAGACFTVHANPAAGSGLSPNQHILFLQNLLKGVNKFQRPEYIITSIRNGMLPNPSRLQLDWPETLAFLYGMQPDGLMIYADHNTTDEEIERIIQLATAITSSPTLALLLGHGKEVAPNVLNRLKKECNYVIKTELPGAEKKILAAIQLLKPDTKTITPKPQTV